MIEKMTTAGTGNSRSRVPKGTQVELNNTRVSRGEIRAFMIHARRKDLQKFGEIHVDLSYRKTKRCWGTAWPLERRMTLYRHSVWVFLHELAHITGEARGHGVKFARELDMLVKMWNEWKEGLSE